MRRRTATQRALCLPNSIYARLRTGGYDHKSVNHGRGEFARDEDGDGVYEVHVNTMEGFWSLLRSWLRPHRGISQEKLPLYLGFFEFVHTLLLDSGVLCFNMVRESLRIL